MARLWEDTLVIALRDAQWLRAAQMKPKPQMPRDAFPDSFVKLDGQAEQLTADILYQTDARFFLFEVKSTTNEIKDEWVKKGRYKPKKPYRKLRAELHAWSNDVADIRSTDLRSQHLRASLQCHHLVWWAHNQVSTLRFGNIRFQPYIDAAVQFRRAHGPTASYTMRTPPCDFTLGKKSGTHVFNTQKNMPFDLIQSGGGFVLATVKEGEERIAYWAQPIGLELNDFQRYINFLCDNEGDEGDEGDEEGEEIHAIVLSSDGSFMRVLTHTTQLRSLFSPTPTEPLNLPPSKSTRVNLVADTPSREPSTHVVRHRRNKNS